MQPKTIIAFAVSSLVIALAGLSIFLISASFENAALFVLLSILSAFVALTALGKSFILRIQLRTGKLNPQVFLVIASGVFAIFQIANIYIEIVNSLFFVLVFIFALGFCIISLARIKPASSRIEYVAIAYPLSVSTLAIFGTIALVFPPEIRAKIEAIAIMFLAIASFLLSRKESKSEDQKQRELTLKNSDFTLIIILAMFAFFFIVLYPRLSSFLGLDIAGNYIQALAFSKGALGTFSHPSAVYPLFGVYESSIINSVKPSLETFQLLTVSLNLLALLTFYAMARQYFRGNKGFIAAVATLIWGAFAGFGWLGFLNIRIGDQNAAFLSVANQANAFSFGDITWRRLFFNLSMETSLTLVFAVFYFLRRRDISRVKLTAIMSLLLAPIPLMHPYATYFLFAVAICFAFMGISETRENLKCLSYSLVIGSFIGLALSYILALKTTALVVNFFTSFEYIAIGLTVFSIVFVREKIQKRLVFKNKSWIRYALVLTSIFLIILFLGSLLLWLSGGVHFDFYSLNIFGYVPWFLYPEKLGVAGILAIIGLAFLASNKSREGSKELAVLFVSVLLMIVASVTISAMQMQYTSTFSFDPNSLLSESIRSGILSFREERMFELFKIPLAIVASVVLCQYLVTKQATKKIPASNLLMGFGLVTIVLISGMASTFLGFGFYYNQIQTNPADTSTLNMISSLQKNIYEDGKAMIISPQTSPSTLDFTGATTIVTESQAAWQSKNPEFPLFVTRYSKLTPTYIYLDKTRDYARLEDYAGNYLQHLTNITDVNIENQNIQIKKVNNTSIPVAHSSAALVIPYDVSTMTLTRPLLQEEDKQNIAAALFFGLGTDSQNVYQKPINYTNVQINGTAIFDGKSSYIRINGSQTNFEKIFVEIEYQPLSLTQNQVLAAKFDYGSSTKSWEVAQYGSKIVFKISSDGTKEEVLQTANVLEENTVYTVECTYDGNSMSIAINQKPQASKQYDGGIFKSATDLTIGAELTSNKPAAYASILLDYVRILYNIPILTEPTFSSYDLLSSLGLNYTSILSVDRDLGTYRTLILPYDDPTTQTTIEQIRSTQEESKTNCVIIINANGYGPLLDVFGNKTSETLTVDHIIADQNYSRRTSIDVPSIVLNPNTYAQSQYASGNSSSPLVMITTQDRLTLVYLNIYPLLTQNQLLQPTVLQTLSKSLSNYIDTYDGATITDWFTEPSLLFTGLEANGTIRVNSNSVVSTNLTENQTAILQNYDKIQIESSDITVQKGFGFYSVMTFTNPLITLLGNQSVLLNINGTAQFLVRQPEIIVDGEIKFENFYMLHPPTIFTDGRNTTLSGNMSLNIYLSDEYTIALPYKLNSPITVTYEKPLMQFNEAASLMQLFPYVLLTIVIYISVMLIQRSKLANGKTTKKENNLVMTKNTRLNPEAASA